MANPIRRKRSVSPFTFVSAAIDEPQRSCYEGCDLGRDPSSRQAIVRLTSAAIMSNLIYCEQPYGSPDGKRIAMIRTSDLFNQSYKLIIGDLDTFKLTLIEPSVTANIGHTAWGEWLYYVTHERALRRVSMTTLEKQPVLAEGKWPEGFWIASITPDGKTALCHTCLIDRYNPPALTTVDLKTGKHRVIFQDPININPHAQIEYSKPAGDRTRILYQLVGNGGVPVFMSDLDGKNRAQVPLGKPWSSESSGHMAFVPHVSGNPFSGKVACAMDWDHATRKHDPRHPKGNLLIAGAGDKQPAVFAAPEHGFYHASVSRCGTYFVCDDFMDFEMDAFGKGHIGPVRIVVGNLLTRKYRVLVTDCQSYGLAGSSWYEPVPYFTADNRHVIYNASPFGTNHVFAVRVSPEFLKSLD